MPKAIRILSRLSVLAVVLSLPAVTTLLPVPLSSSEEARQSRRR